MTAAALDGERLLADSIAGKFPDAPGRAAARRPVRRPLRARTPHPRVGEAGRRHPTAFARQRLPARIPTAAEKLGRPPDRPDLRRKALRALGRKGLAEA